MYYLFLYYIVSYTVSPFNYNYLMNTNDAFTLTFYKLAHRIFVDLC